MNQIENPELKMFVHKTNETSTANFLIDSKGGTSLSKTKDSISEYLEVFKNVSKNENDLAVLRKTDENSNYNSPSETIGCANDQSFNKTIVKYESLIDKINKRIETKQPWFSLEFFPPKTINGAANLISKCLIFGYFNLF
jgi:hypothetical protein